MSDDPLLEVHRKLWSNVGLRRDFWRSFLLAFSLRPLAVAIPTMMIPVGIATFILGEGASRAFSLIGGGSHIANAMGFLLALGGIITMLGTLRLGTLMELLGLVFISAGAFIYAAGVFIGLGIQGLIAGSAYAAIAIGCAGRVILLSSVATELNKDDDLTDDHEHEDEGKD